MLPFTSYRVQEEPSHLKVARALANLLATV